MRKKFLPAIIIALLISVGIVGFTIYVPQNQEVLNTKNKSDFIMKNVESNVEVENRKNNISKEYVAPKVLDIIEKKANLYSYDNTVPLFVIAQMADASPAVQSKIDSIFEDTSLYFYKKNGDENIVIVGNTGGEKYIRHDVHLLSFNDNEEVCLAFGDAFDEDAKKNNKWKFDKDTNLPLEHIKYLEKNVVEYKEIWNYSEDEPIKYELKDGDDNTISLKKETKENESNIRIDNILYNKDGSIKINISLTYEGANVVRFIYYNSENIDDSRTIMYEYQNGEKVKEVVYSSDYKKQNTYLSEYQEGERTQIRILDSKEIEFAKILSL